MTLNIKKPVIGITLGDMNGIGPEVVIKTFSDHRILEFCTPVIYGSVAVINYHRKALGNIQFSTYQINDAQFAKPGRINIVNCWQDTIRMNFGQKNPENARYIAQALELAVQDAKSGKIEALVTAPINKSVMQSESFPFPGHTEFITQAFGGESLMFFIGENLRMGMVTSHIPLSQVSSSITGERIIKKLKLLNNSLKVDFGIPKPVIAILGLNPHSGEEGLLGKEEQEIIIPVIEEAKTNGLMVLGPFPSDGFFGTALYRSYDATLAMYHDQGLIPFKLMNFNNGVNYTAGLPLVRTSPDHGTGFAIAGKNEANEQSFRESVFVALEIIKNRNLTKELTAQPLKTQLVKEREV